MLFRIEITYESGFIHHQYMEYDSLELAQEDFNGSTIKIERLYTESEVNNEIKSNIKVSAEKEKENGPTDTDRLNWMIFASATVCHFPDAESCYLELYDKEGHMVETESHDCPRKCIDEAME